MKIVNRDYFLQHPENTVYQELREDNDTSQIFIKGKTLSDENGTNIDFFLTDLTIGPYDWRTIDTIQKQGTELLDLVRSRDGQFDDKLRYLVYDKSDISILIEALKLAL